MATSPEKHLPELEIVRLRDCPAALDRVVEWIHREWSAFSGRSREQTLERFAAEFDPSSGELPLSLLAMEDDTPAGLLSLRERDSVDFDPGTRPWICNVYVDSAFRGRGIARLLCDEAERVALSRGFESVFLASERGPGSLYAEIGYLVYKVYEKDGILQYLMRKPLVLEP